LAGLDIALRRRFSFKEMPPQPDLLRSVTVSGISIADLLSVLNERIEVLLDRDHCLGHAYFIPLKLEPTMERLASIFRNQVLPLLQEYFFEDWQRIQWVLNDHRKVDPADHFVYQSKADLSVLFGDKVPVSVHNMPWRINQQAFTRATAYRSLIATVHQPTVPASEPDAVNL
jgi:5-methylcytosine-specific restriction protein B